MEELELMNEIYLYAIFMSVIENFGIEYRSVTFFRYKKTSILDDTLGVIHYNTEELKKGNDDLILRIPDFSSVPEEYRYKAIEGFFAHENGHLKDALTQPSWIKRIFRFLTKEINVDRLAEKFGYKSSLEKFKQFFIYPYYQRMMLWESLQYTHHYWI